ncbi:hypothetical protein llap_8701 [Limosa lapponica baueri]|uniref:Uncharacterized protein n=1 Tax=Limosa lapponica baueri TaxID=1758121 RepID=A0A2I0U4J4_LIMLA|nr:hypothetical protein llap_8701 [Limosa lapponica baueri]
MVPKESRSLALVTYIKYQEQRHDVVITTMKEVFCNIEMKRFTQQKISVATILFLAGVGGSSFGHIRHVPHVFEMGFSQVGQVGKPSQRDQTSHRALCLRHTIDCLKERNSYDKAAVEQADTQLILQVKLVAIETCSSNSMRPLCLEGMYNEEIVSKLTMSHLIHAEACE